MKPTLTLTSTISDIRQLEEFKFVGKLPTGEDITISLSDPKDAAPEWRARHRQAKGEITQEQADHIVRIARIVRRLRSAKSRNNRRELQ